MKLPLAFVPGDVIRPLGVAVRLNKSASATAPGVALSAPAPAIPTLTVTPATSTIAIGASVALTVTASAAPDADLIIAVASVNTDVATLDVASVTILAGATTATFNATGVSGGGTVATATADGYLSTPASITVTPAAATFANDFILWTRRSDTGGNTANTADPFVIENDSLHVEARGIDSNNVLLTNEYYTPPAADYFVECALQFNVVPSFFLFELFARGTGTKLFTLPSPPSSDWLFAYFDNGAETSIGRWADDAETVRSSPLTFTTGLHTFRLEVEGMVARSYYDGTLVLTNSGHLTTLSGAGVAPGACGFLFDDSDLAAVTDVVVKRFRVGSL